MNLSMTILERSHVPDDMQARYMRPRVGPTMFPPSTWQTPPRHAPFTKAGTLDYARKKRIFDLAIALPLAVATLPLVVILAIGSAISFRAWPIFTQIRLGHHGKEFRFLKIRSLPVDAPAAADKYELSGGCPEHSDSGASSASSTSTNSPSSGWWSGAR
jgi:lipopolysaccharide/colanic/teichoic acid biosynthesis glycosyltransferase